MCVSFIIFGMSVSIWVCFPPQYVSMFVLDSVFSVPGHVCEHSPQYLGMLVLFFSIRKHVYDCLESIFLVYLCYLSLYVSMFMGV